MHKVLYFQTKFAGFQAKSIKNEKSGKEDKVITISGFASTPDVDRVNDRVLPTAFSKSLPVFMKNPVMLLQHDDNKVIGQFTETNIKSNGLEVTGDVMYDTDECMRKIEDGVLGAFSIGFICKAYQYEDEQGHIIYTSMDGMSAGYSWDDLWADGVIRVITEVDLVEISVVATPANPYALFQTAKDFFIEETKTLKSLARKGAPNEQEEEKKSTEGEQTPESTPETNPNPTGEEAPAGETPAPVEGQAPEGGEAPTGESPVEQPEDTPKSVTLEEVKALIDEAVTKALSEYSKTVEAQVKAVSDENVELKKQNEKLVEAITQVETDIKNIEVPRSATPGSTPTARKNFVVTDEMVIKSLGV
jgi:HK97 family phage prohead protease